jgi:DNA-binding CsgD family transcriptional regulator
MNHMELNQQFKTAALHGRDVEQNNTLSSAVEMSDQTAAVALTTRQREVMLWTAEGKTAFEISVIVGLTERTVNFHISRVLAKLGANNKTQAAVRATLMGLLFEECPDGHRRESRERDTLSR